jgi:hypothetical protein
MKPMPKPFFVMILVSALATYPACAQRGTSAGHGVGFASHGSVGFAPHTAATFHTAPTFGGHPTFTLSPHSSSINVSQRPMSAYSNRGYGGFHDIRYRRPYSRSYTFRSGYGVNGWVAPGYLGYLDSGLYDDSSAGAPQPDYPDSYEDAAPAPPSEQAENEPEDRPAPVFRRAYVRPQPEPDPAPDTAVTLIFKDGRPSEQIHNYMLTRTTLYVQGQHLRQIPVDQLDLDATSKVNMDAGIDFRLPSAAR